MGEYSVVPPEYRKGVCIAVSCELMHAVNAFYDSKHYAIIYLLSNPN
jgi:hypothetical protein